MKIYIKAKRRTATNKQSSTENSSKILNFSVFYYKLKKVIKINFINLIIIKFIIKKIN